MQAPQINCLTTAMTEYCKATRSMEQVVMFPSLLRDVPMEKPLNPGNECKDLYHLYIKLKTVRINLEHGLIPVEDQEIDADIKTMTDMDNEGMFYHHFKGLFCILGQLAQESNILTNKYKDLIGMVH
ncbi:mid1-interacting protein 1A-like [Pelobates fuscus]|uniref:mid1-interacting protein 1A-like n=1 Tax=Pelobates fuscus TaxID=191477 RepID=UPI002FE46C0E